MRLPMRPPLWIFATSTNARSRPSRKPKALHIARLDEFLDGAGSYFDGRVAIDAKLGEKVDDVGLQPIEQLAVIFWISRGMHGRYGRCGRAYLRLREPSGEDRGQCFYRTTTRGRPAERGHFGRMCLAHP
jgi:hypothetical protein